MAPEVLTSSWLIQKNRAGEASQSGLEVDYAKPRPRRDLNESGLQRFCLSVVVSPLEMWEMVINLAS